MVCSAVDLVGWSDFPKGLRVLLLVKDSPSTTDVKSKLEEMDYIVTLFHDENEALEAISNSAESFHVAMVEVAIGNSHGRLRFLEMSRGLPTIMISNSHCLSTMMKCIALGAAEFLQKPLSEDKLRNIWQHVVHKAFNAGGSVLSKSLNPIKETIVTMLRLQSDMGTNELENQNSSEVEYAGKYHESQHENSVPNDRFPAPSTPQLEHGGRSSDGEECQDHPNFSTVDSKEHVKDSVELREFSSKSRSVDNTCNDLTRAVHKDEFPSTPRGISAEEDVDSTGGSKTNECSASKECLLPSSQLNNGDHVDSSAEDRNKTSVRHSPYSFGNRRNKKKMKVDWTPELHRKFVQAVEQLGIDQAIPSKILELMKVEGLTRHNIASHLQKYRMHIRHVLPKDEERRWQKHRDPMLRGYMHKPLVAFPPIHSHYCFPPSQVYSVWGHPSCHSSSIQMWGHAGFPTWQPSRECWSWMTYPRMHADAWGCPVVPTQCQFPTLPQNQPQTHGVDLVDYHNGASRNSHNFHPEEEVIDKLVKEAISKPWLPLPLGLKPPSTDSVLAELHRQGICNIPPPHSSSSPPPLHR